MKTFLLNQAQEAFDYHPHYIAAILFSDSAAQTNQQQNQHQNQFENWQIPSIEFTTDNKTRRSMTVNGMRMATEFFAHDSPRILTLVEQRLQAGQRDVVHDVLVYLWERVLLMRANAQESKKLQSESLAAYLGLEPNRVGELFRESPLSAARIAQRIQSNEAGKPQREIDVLSLTENLLARLQPELEEMQQNEDRILFLIEEIITRLYSDEA